jgi:DNA invertase Pin-like site-specific DNA recombinase
MKVALYARVSTDDKGQDPETQLLKLRQFAASKGYEIIGEFADRASGANPDRPQLVKMIEKSRSYDAIIITKLDRMMRSTKNLLNVLEDLEKKGVALICVDQPIETNTAMGRMLLQILSAVAEFELELCRSRTKDGQARAKKQGKIIGRRPKRSGEVSRATYYRLKKEGVVDLNTLTVKDGSIKNVRLRD